MASSFSSLRLNWRMLVSALIALAIAVASVLSLGASNARAVSVEPVFVSGNPSCSTLNASTDPAFASITSNFGFKLNGYPAEGTYYFTNAYGELTGSAPADATNFVTISGRETTSLGQIFDWAASMGIDAVIVKGGDSANAYVYVPEATAGEDLHAPINDSGKYANVSHIEFCYDYEMTASKTANATYTRTYSWTIDKSVSPNSHSGFTGDTFSSDYDVVVDQTVADSNFAVTGNIVVNNPTPFTVSFSVADSVGGTAATVDCPTLTLGPGESTTCTYSASLAGAVDGTNTATITSNTAGVGGATASASYAFGDPTTVVGDPTINVTDSVQGPLGSTSGDFTFEYSDDFACPTDLSLYVDGVYSFNVPNRATIVETGQYDDANVAVTCYAPVVTKDADTSLRRTYTWDIDKVGDQTALTLSTGQQFLVNYDVTVSATYADSNHRVTGTIYVFNPADEPITVTVSDVLDDGTIAQVDCDPATAGLQNTLTVAAGQTGTCIYRAAPDDGSATLNTATATLNGIAFTGTADVDFDSGTINEVDECIDVTDDLYGNLGRVCYDEAPKTFEYSMYVGPYDTCGMYEVTNTATFVARSGATGSDSHTVDVNVPCGQGCTLTQGYWKTHSENGPAPYDDAWLNLGDADGDSNVEGSGETFFLSGMTYYEVLWTAPQGNVYYNLAHQYIAATLNVANGASTTADVEEALAWATEFFSSTEPGDKLSKSMRADVLKYAGILDNYNNGLIGPGHCSE